MTPAQGCGPCRQGQNTSAWHQVVRTVMTSAWQWGRGITNSHSRIMHRFRETSRMHFGPGWPFHVENARMARPPREWVRPAGCSHHVLAVERKKLLPVNSDMPGIDLPLKRPGSGALRVSGEPVRPAPDRLPVNPVGPDRTASCANQGSGASRGMSFCTHSESTRMVGYVPLSK